MTRQALRHYSRLLLPLLLLLAAFGGCSRDSKFGRQSLPTKPGHEALSGAAAGSLAPALISQDGSAPPAGLATVAFGARSLSLWPYTGASLDGTPADPVNLIFHGKADPAAIRAALLGLDGDRTSFGFPPVYPFNARWSDAIGDVQTGYAEGEGWQASTIQLQIGAYGPVRAHLRLFRTGSRFGSGETWTVGAAHFEVLIPGTADHQVLSWELAQQLVTVDLIRSGLLDPTSPMAATAAINATPSFRTIPDAIYNGLPEELKAAIGGPAGAVSSPVPIANDGSATIFNIAGEAAPQGGDFSDSFTLTYDQIIPKPLCSDGPLDWIHVAGPVELRRSTAVDASGRYQYHERIVGRLTITPVDVTQSPPAPAGAPFAAEIGDLQNGAIDENGSWATAQARRIAMQSGGTELLMTRLSVGTGGADSYRSLSQCP